jgi:hypothetical protein
MLFQHRRAAVARQYGRSGCSSSCSDDTVAYPDRPGASLAPALELPTLTVPNATFPAEERSGQSIDWAVAGQRASRSVVVALELANRQRQASGESPWHDPNANASPRPAFPWSRQPLTGWFDFDPKTLVASIKLGRHCGLVFLVILPALGCVFEHIDPDPGRGDLLDSKFASRPLQLPEPAIPAAAEPWRAPAENGVVVQKSEP